MKVKVIKKIDQPKIYAYNAYVPHNIVSGGMFLAAGQIYGNQKSVLNRICCSHMIPNRSVISLFSKTSGEAYSFSKIQNGAFILEC